MLQVLSTIYGFPAEYAVSQRDTQQYARVTTEMQRNAQVKSLVERLESDYDARRGRREEQRQSEERKELPPLPPSVEEFLGKLTGPSEEESS